MEVFLKEASFHGVMIDTLLSSSSELKKELHDIMTDGIAKGTVQPLSRTVFSDTEVEQAFRYCCHDGDEPMSELRQTYRDHHQPQTTTAMMIIRSDLSIFIEILFG
jgi:hypothetical protein